MLQAACCKLRAACCVQPAVCSLLRAACCVQPVAFSLLRAACCLCAASHRPSGFAFAALLQPVAHPLPIRQRSALVARSPILATLTGHATTALSAGAAPLWSSRHAGASDGSFSRLGRRPEWYDRCQRIRHRHLCPRVCPPIPNPIQTLSKPYPNPIQSQPSWGGMGSVGMAWDTLGMAWDRLGTAWDGLGMSCAEQHYAA